MDALIKILRALLLRKVASRAEDLVRQSQGTRNGKMVLYLLARELVALGPDLAPFLIRHLVMGSARRSQGYPEYVRNLCDIRALAGHAGNDFMSEVLRKARRCQMDEVVELLTRVPPQRRIYNTEDPEKRNPVQDYIPLGVRKSLARKQNLASLEALLGEQDPSVIRNILGNPRTVEDMVVKMASLRPTSEDVLQEIAVHPRWGGRLKIRKSLVFNPYTSPRTVHAILPTLLLPDLIDAALSPTLHPNVRAAAKRFIIHRVAGMSPAEKHQFNQRSGAILKRIFLETG
ncbi:MAG: hypothetical protein JXR72_05225 [Proteobacteria bacterium]|nr:hypothetical protein [Pseudomonadota bacterium]